MEQWPFPSSLVVGKIVFGETENSEEDPPTATDSFSIILPVMNDRMWFFNGYSVILEAYALLSSSI